MSIETKVHKPCRRLIGLRSESLIEKGCVGEIEFEDGEVIVELNLTGLTREARHALEDEVSRALGAFEEVSEVSLDVSSEDVDVPKSAPADPGITMTQGHGGPNAAKSAPAPTVKPAASALADVQNLIGVDVVRVAWGSPLCLLILRLHYKRRAQRSVFVISIFTVHQSRFKWGLLTPSHQCPPTIKSLSP